VENYLVVCSKCNGTGKDKNSICPKCKGSGKLDWVSNIVGKHLRPVEEIYPDCVLPDGGFDRPSGYQPMLQEFGHILVQVDDQDYQGDSRIFYENNGQYGYLQFGWGSCSGCDALQGCHSVLELNELIEDLCQRILWFDSREDAIKFFETHDWGGDYGHGEEQKEFVGEVIKFLKSI
jgi:hypothetical protein